MVMAEDYGVSLKITADTSDLDKIPQKVEATRKEIEQPVEQTVVEKREQGTGNRERTETVKIKEEREPAAPVEHPAETVAVQERRETAAPVEHTAETVKVKQDPDPLKPNVEKPAPVKIEAKADKVRVEVEDEEAKKRIEALTAKEGIKRIRVVTEGGDLASRQGGKEIFEIEVDTEKARETIADLKKDNRIKFIVDPPVVPKIDPPKPIKLAIDTTDAAKSSENLFSGLRSGLLGIRSAITSTMRAFGVFSLAVGGIMALVEGFRKLHEIMLRSEVAAARLREEIARSNYEASVAAATIAYEKLNSRIADTLRLEKERNQILSARKAVDRANEDAALEKQKQDEISKLNPNDKNYDRQKREIEVRYSTIASNRTAARADEDVRDKAKDLYRSADVKENEANGRQAEYERAQRIADQAVENRFRISQEIRRKGPEATEEDKKRYQEADEEVNKAVDRAKGIRLEIEEARKQAQEFRNQAAEALGGNVAARIANEANKKRIQNEQKAEQGRVERENAEKDKRQQNAQSAYTEERDRRAADADFDARFRASQRISSDPNSTEAQRNAAENDQLEMLRGKEDAAKAELKAAEKELAEEMAKDAKDRDEDRMARSRERAASAQGDQISAAGNGGPTGAADELTDDDHIHNVVHHLQEVGQHKGIGKTQQQLRHVACRQVVDHGLFTAHGITSEKY